VSVLLVIAAAILRPRTVSKGSPSDEIGGFFVSHPAVTSIAVAATIVIFFFLWPRLKPRLLQQWRKAKEGAAIFRDWRPLRNRGGAALRRLILLLHGRERRLHGRSRHPRDRVQKPFQFVDQARAALLADDVPQATGSATSV
jgi:hypothetical protein